MNQFRSTGKSNRNQKTDELEWSKVIFVLKKCQLLFTNPIPIAGDEKRWTSNTTQLLLQLFLDRKKDIQDPLKKKRDVWKFVVLELKEHGIHETEVSVDRKYRNLKKTYETITRQKRQTRWEHFERMHAILGHQPAVFVSPRKKRRSPEVLYLNDCPEDQNDGMVDYDDSYSASTNSKTIKIEPEVMWESSPMVDKCNMTDTEASSISGSNYSVTKERELQCATSNSSTVVNILQDLVKDAKQVPAKPPFKNMEVLTYWDFLLNDMTPAAAREARHKITNLLQNFVTANPKKEF
ncbi:uncharacterized protein LOC111075995 [Drosophila obscura]|uniref:uncharacterized protein LOC111075995 n=1 Tax=Drosophila obscura TaxID=7282 RepID=UPI001BB1C52A|nr:uncharacterized protein LOC111075995 [Drosophila obscura]